jgi:hypothetical protein
LSSFEQHELVLTIANPDGLELPVGIFDFVVAIGRYASEGQLVGPPGVTMFEAPGPFNFGQFLGAVYTPATTDHNIGLPPDALQVILLRDGELEMAHRCSTWRVLARLGEIAGFFPWPFWSDPSRPSAYQVGDSDHSVLSRVPQLRFGRLDVSVDGTELVATFDANNARQLASWFNTHHYAAVVPDPDPTSDATLIWSPDQPELTAITRDPTTTTSASARFLMIVSEGPKDEIAFREDGCSLLLSPTSTTELIHALAHAQGAEISCAELRVSFTVSS